MEVKVREAAKDVILVELKGRLVAGTGDELLHDVVDELLAGGWKKIVLDLSEVPRIDSAGIGELVAGIRLGERFQARMAMLMRPDSQVKKVLSLSQILPLLEIYDDEADAVASFASPPGDG